MNNYNWMYCQILQRSTFCPTGQLVLYKYLLLHASQRGTLITAVLFSYDSLCSSWHLWCGYNRTLQKQKLFPCPLLCESFRGFPNETNVGTCDSLFLSFIYLFFLVGKGLVGMGLNYSYIHSHMYIHLRKSTTGRISLTYTSPLLALWGKLCSQTCLNRPLKGPKKCGLLT